MRAYAGPPVALLGSLDSPEVAGIELGNFGALIPVLEAAGYPL